MKIPIVFEKKVETVADVVAEMAKLDQSAKVENDFPDEDLPAELSIWRDEKTGKISIKMAL